jgi:hypothetical protein
MWVGERCRWNAVDAVILLQNTEHYYAYKKNSHNASSNWSRLQKKAAKVQFSFFSHQGRKNMPACLSVCFVANPFCCNPLCVALCFFFCRSNPFRFLHADCLSLLCCNSFAYFNKIDRALVWSCIRVFFSLSCGRNPFECCSWFVSSGCLRDC